MEEKKILWIVAALGIFLLVIFLGTLIIYSPENTASQTVVATAEVPNGAWVTQQAIIPQQPENTNVATQDPMNPAMNSNRENQNTLPTNTIQTEDITVISQGTTTVYSQNDVTTIDLTNTKNQATETAPEPSVKPVTTRVPSTTKVAEAPKEVSKPVEQKREVAPKAPVQKAPQEQYWVQAASYVSKANADNARSVLEGQKIPAEVFTHADNSGVTYYRVRVGPYTTKSEAEYWNSLIKTVDTFAEAQSYVTSSSKPIS